MAMTNIRWPLLIRRTHKWLALFVGIQVVLWTLTGFYMVTVHIDYIHGDHLVRAPAAQPFTLGELVDAPEVIAAYPQAEEIKLHRLLGEPAWRVRTAEGPFRSEEHTSELQSLMRISYAVFCLK